MDCDIKEEIIKTLMKVSSEHILENPEMSENKKFEISIVVVGDSRCGKTQLINRFTNSKFSKVKESNNLIRVSRISSA